PSYSINLAEHGEILSVHCSTYEWSQDIMLIVFTNKILVAQLDYQDKPKFDVLAEFQHNVICTNIYLSSDTAINIVPMNIQFCTASIDFKLRVFKGNLSDENTCEELVGHTSYINDLNYDPENIYIVSVSDDHTARIWTTADNKQLAILKLTSPGMSTCWHKDDNSKLLVAEKVGIIRFYNVGKQKPILSFDYGKPLASAHWAPFDSQLIASLQMGELLLWDMTRSSRPIQNNLMYTEGGGEVKFSPATELIA
ncbi:WD40 domain-containing protein, partial [Oryctes borbonicus]